MKMIASILVVLALAAPLQALFIAGIGAPASGKTSVFQALHKLMPGSVLHFEPDEDEWPDVVRSFSEVNIEDFQLGLRALWIPNIRRAYRDSQAGEVVLLDSYYPKFYAYMLGHSDTQWILPNDNPYFSEIEAITKKDLELLPNPDVFIYLEPSFETWKQLINKRGRQFEVDNPHTHKWFSTNEYIKNTLKHYEDQGVLVLRVPQVFSSPETTARLAYSMLKECGLIAERDESCLDEVQY